MSHCDCCSPTTKVSRTVYVDSVFGSNKCGRPESPIHPYRTLNTAIRNTPEGWTVHIRPGEYYGAASLFNRYLYAELESVIHITSPEFMDGVISFVGYADLLIDEGSQAYIYFSKVNSVGRSQLTARMFTDKGVAGVEASLQVKMPQPVAVTVTLDEVNTHKRRYVAKMYCPKGYHQCKIADVSAECLSENKTPIRLTVTKATNFSPSGSVVWVGTDTDISGDSFQSGGTVVVLGGGFNVVQVKDISGVEWSRAETGVQAMAGATVESKMTFGNVLANMGLDLGAGSHQVTIKNLGFFDVPMETAVRLKDITKVQMQVDYAYALHRIVSWNASSGGSVSYSGTQAGDMNLRPQTAFEVTRSASVSGTALTKAEWLLDIERLYAEEYGLLFGGSIPAELKALPKIKTVDVVGTALHVDDPTAEVSFNGNKLVQHGKTVPAVVNRAGKLALTLQQAEAWKFLANLDRTTATLGDVTTTDDFLVPPDSPGSPVTQITAERVTTGGSIIAYIRPVGAVLPLYDITFQTVRTGREAFIINGDPVILHYNNNSLTVAPNYSAIRDATASTIYFAPSTVTGSYPGALLDFSRAQTGKRTLSTVATNSGPGPVLGLSGAAAVDLELYSATLLALNNYAIILSDVAEAVLKLTSATVTTSAPLSPADQILRANPDGAQFMTL